MAKDNTKSINNVNLAYSKIASAAELHKSVDIASPEICVICLDRIHEKAIALPCKHSHFDFPCLGTWLQQQRVCPLCKATVNAVEYSDVGADSGGKIFHLPTHELPRRPEGEIRQRRVRAQHQSTRRSNRVRPRVDENDIDKEVALEFRRQIYRRRTPCMHVGTNPISRYRNVTPSSFQQNPDQVTRAKAFIRRELGVFDFLQPSSSTFGTGDRRASNAEFLLEYIISILKTIDLRGSNGQAQELLKDFLGRENATLFLHELEAWLRSPFERLEQWDQCVQYDNHQANDHVS